MAIKKLSILFMKGGFSFCVLKDNELVHSEEIKYETKQFELRDNLADVFNKQLYLSQEYNQVDICYLGNQFNLIPNAYFEKDNDAQKWLEFSSEIYEEDMVTFTKLKTIPATLAFAYPRELETFLKEKFYAVKIKNASQVFIDSISTTSEVSELFLNIHSSQIEILMYKKAQLQLYNIFDITTKEDIVYYVLNAIQQLGFDANTVKLYYFGWKIDEPSLKMLMNFVRHVMPGTDNEVELQFFTEIQNIR